MKVQTVKNRKLIWEFYTIDSYVNGEEASIKEIDCEYIYFENSKIKLIDSDIHHLAYLNEVI